MRIHVDCGPSVAVHQIGPVGVRAAAGDEEAKGINLIVRGAPWRFDVHQVAGLFAYVYWTIVGHQPPIFG